MLWSMWIWSPFKTILLVELILFVQLDVFYFFVGTGRVFCCFGFTRVNPNFGQRQLTQDVQSRGFSDYWCKKCVDTCKYTTIVFPICYGACIAVLMNSDTPWSFCETWLNSLFSEINMMFLNIVVSMCIPHYILLFEIL